MPKLSSIVARIADHANSHSDRTAVVDEKSRLSFADLETRSSKLAARLQAEGARPGTSAGLFLDRSVEFVVTALAVLKTGAAYVPLDPATPLDRALGILRDADAPFVLTHRDKTRSWPASVRAIDVELANGQTGDFTPVDADPEAWPTSSTPQDRPVGPRESKSRMRTCST